MRWGLVPHWANDPSVGSRLINARAETLRTKRAFQDAFARRRCICPADAFYEWRRTNRRRQPYVIGRADEEPLAFAGLWELWRPRDASDAEPLRTCTIITTASNQLVAPLHNRMPAILPAEAWDAWLDPDNRNLDRLQALLEAPTAEGLVAHPVGPRVNNVRNDGPDLLSSAS
jgi:putative SOS response-associated peptidase YedK